MRRFCPDAAFIFTSTNKVYGDAPNELPLVEHETRWEIDQMHPYYEFGIDESLRIDQCKHSLFGASKVAGDILVQEYGRYFGMPTCCLRGGCLTGPAHSGVELHGFLSFLVKCNIEERTYKIFGYQGASFDKGGYKDGEYNDLSWLPEPRIEEHPDLTAFLDGIRG